jgi:hypothetical protein
MSVPILKKLEDSHRLHRVNISRPGVSSEMEEFGLFHFLPATHRSILNCSNGLMVFNGYFRLFGCGAGASIDMKVWNELSCWKFAWPNRKLEQFVSFGESAWGDQYAYSIDELLCGTEPRVFFFDAYNMSSEVLSGNFNEFLENEILRCSTCPYDAFTVSAYQRLGALTWDEHVIQVPSILITGHEAIEAIEKIDARSAMIINGDLATQLSERTEGKLLERLDTITDELGRMRINVVWKQ